MNGTAALTLTALRRWSSQDRPLPPVAQIKSIHVYDFDNTLFASPLPNRSLWATSTYGSLQASDFFIHGGWWQNSRILAATGAGVEDEEARAWDGFWNERIVELARLSIADAGTLTLLLTGRQENGFAELISRMTAAKDLHFDIFALKPRVSPSGELFASTMAFKQALLRDLALTYTDAEDLRIYEDRPKHVKGFRDFFSDFNRSLMPSMPREALRPPFVAEVVQVSEQETVMDPVSEVAEVQSMVNDHNRAILDGTAPPGSVPYKLKRSVFYTGYLINQQDTKKLKSLVRLPANCPDHEIRHLANSILITPRPAPRNILADVGGLGAKVSWRVTGVASLEQRVWAARVRPTTPGVRIYTENKTPCVVLATRRQAKPIEASRIQNWQPVAENEAFEFETTVGEKVLLRIDEETAEEDAYEASFPLAKNVKQHLRSADVPPLGPQNNSAGVRSAFRPQPQGRAWASRGSGGNGIGFAGQRGGGHAGRAGRGGGPRRASAGGGWRGRGRGGYRSLDDNVGQGYGVSGMQY